MKYGQFYYGYGVYGTEGSPNMYLASSSASATTAFLNELRYIEISSITQSSATADVKKLWDTTPLSPATWTTVALQSSVWTDQTAPSADWQDTRI